MFARIQYIWGVTFLTKKDKLLSMILMKDDQLFKPVLFLESEVYLKPLWPYRCYYSYKLSLLLHCSWDIKYTIINILLYF